MFFTVFFFLRKKKEVKISRERKFFHPQNLKIELNFSAMFALLLLDAISLEANFSAMLTLLLADAIVKPIALTKPFSAMFTPFS